ncbi:CshA/CshB family fibrillar adhesin-related protein [Lysobacter firmicutimachus]|uniref:CshA/CshB family fibrillar adhesin-related protein n=1 Tax=Lysobacter firmicutimachus TaxID=1792846 RepID=A0AAU8MYZ2_9GAMM
MASAPPAAAQYATGGSGQYRGQILWFDWGTAPNNIPQAGTSVVNTFNVAGQTLTVTCSLSNIASAGADPDLRIYRPGGFGLDGLDDLYNIGGTGPANTMDIGLMNRNGGANVSFTYSCSATFGGVPYAIDGLVFADAETTSPSEYTEVVLPAGATMRVIERLRGGTCTDGYNVVVTGTTYRFSPLGECRGAGDIAPMGVFFIDNASSANIVLQGGVAASGLQAVAVGVMLNVADFGDAPNSYGMAGHVPQYSWSGGTLPAGTTNIFGAGFNLATQTQPIAALLGTRADVESSALFSANALGDDNDSGNGTDDEDGVNIAAAAPLYRGLSGNTYNLTAACVGTAPVAGWIDFDRNGTFDSDERSGTALCAGGSATLFWSVPTDIAAGASFLRVRTAANALEIANPTGVAGTGEVEDHTLTILDPQIRIAKLTQAGAGGPFSFATTNTLSQPGALTTVAADTAVTGAPVSIDDIASAVTATESALPADWQLTAIACTQAGGAAVAGATYDLVNRRATIPSSALSTASDITCSFTNGKRPILRLAKALPLGRFVAADQFALSIAGPGGPATATTTGSGTAAPEVATLNPGTIGGAYTLSETAAAGANLGNYTVGYACTNALAGGQTPSGSGSSFAITAATGDDLTCTLTNTRNPISDLSVTKTNTPAAGPNDQAGDAVSRNASTTYSIVVTNNGPDAVTGAILRDPAASRVGLSCTTPPVCTGAGCPAAPLTLAGLEAGAPLGTIANGASVTVTLSCLVN